MLKRDFTARHLAGLFVGALAAMPAVAQEAPLIPASIEDATRVHVSFLTMDLLMERCTAATGEAGRFAQGRDEWTARNAPLREIADLVLAHFQVEVDLAALQPRAEEDSAALLNSLVTPAELCAKFLGQIPAGELDLAVLVPDLELRLSQSAQMLGAAN